MLKHMIISSISAHKIKVIEHKMVSDESTPNMDLHTERLPEKLQMPTFVTFMATV